MPSHDWTGIAQALVLTGIPFFTQGVGEESYTCTLTAAYIYMAILPITGFRNLLNDTVKCSFTYSSGV